MNEKKMSLSEKGEVMKTTVFVPVEKWKRGQGGGWGDGVSGGCANTFIQKAQGVMAHFGATASKLDPVVTGEIIRINDNAATPDDYKKKALQALLEPYGVTLVFVEPPCATQKVLAPVAHPDDEEAAEAAEV